MKPLRLVVALGVMLLGATVAAAGPAWTQTASAALKHPIICRSMSGTSTGQVELSGCNRQGITGGSGTQLSCVPTGSCPITWSTGKEVNFTFSRSSPTNRCPFPVSTSGSWTKQLIGGPVAFDVCFSTQIQVVLVELVPGTLFMIG
jgi:hypothetical protein